MKLFKPIYLLVFKLTLELLFFFVVEILQPLLVCRPVIYKIDKVIHRLFLAEPALLKIFQSLF